MRANELAELLKPRALELCYELLPCGFKTHNEYEVADISGNPGKSLSVCVGGLKAGMWCDFANNDMKGDLIGLISKTRNLSLKQSCDYAEKFLGIFEDKPQFKVKPMPKNYTRPKITSGVSMRHLEYLNSRKISESTMVLFKVYVDMSGNRICFPSYVENELYRVKSLKIERIDGKKEMIVTQNSEPCLFGWQALDGTERRIIICEGEIDALSWYEYGYPALSVPMGAGNHQWIESDFERLEVFDEILINFDEDAAGIKGAQEVIERLGAERCRQINLPCKDCNECLMQGVSKKNIDNLVSEAKNCDPADIKNPDFYTDKVLRIFHPHPDDFLGLDLPWNTADFIKLRPNELSVWGGINGHGKSAMLTQVIIDAISKGKKCCIASMEVNPEIMLADMMLQISGGKIQPSEPYCLKMIEYMSNGLFIFDPNDYTGVATVDRLLKGFEYVNKKYGVDQFLIDSLMAMDINDDDYNKQKEFMRSLCSFRKKFSCHVHLVTHIKKQKDEYVPLSKMDVMGSVSVANLPDNIFIVCRNKLKEEMLDKEKNKLLTAEEEGRMFLIKNSPDAFLKCVKQRRTGKEGIVKLWFDAPSKQFTERDGSMAYKIYLEENE